MPGAELVIFFISSYYSYKFFKIWYWSSFKSWPPERAKLIRNVFMSLPVISSLIILFTLGLFASFDVVGSLVYILFYLALGYAWIYLSLTMTSLFFDISWIDDGLNIGNKAVLAPVAGSFLAATVIYSGANIGDGPGWWCVVFAGGLGVCTWFVLCLLINRLANIFERITIERDISCGLRIGGYMLGSGIILGRASAGDWTSFGMTIIEFMDGWPVLALVLLTLVIEIYYNRKYELESGDYSSSLPSSAILGIFYVIISIVIVAALPPLKHTGLYSMLKLFVL